MVIAGDPPDLLSLSMSPAGMHGSSTFVVLHLKGNIAFMLEVEQDQILPHLCRFENTAFLFNNREKRRFRAVQRFPRQNFAR